MGINWNFGLGETAKSSELLQGKRTILFKLSWFPPLVPLPSFHLLVFQEGEEEEEGKGNFD